MRGTRKDHKETKDKKLGPDLRPIMGAVVGPNIGLSEIGSKIVRKIADTADVGLVAKSTEEVLNKIETYNKRRFEKIPGLKKLIIASMDIEKFYPSIISEKSAKIIRKMWEESEISVEGIDFDKLSEYLGKHLKKEEIIAEQFEDILYTRKVKERKKRKVTKKIGKKHASDKKGNKVRENKVDKENMDKEMDISSSEGADTHKTTENKKKKTQPVEWMKPKRNPTRIEQRSMFGKALEILIIMCMNNHVYQFANSVRIQKQGGPIGLKLTGEIADCLMIDWDKKLLEKLKSYQIIPELYTRFKDDIELAIESLEKGSKLVDDKILIDESKKLEDVDKTDSKITMEIIQQIANEINPMIRLTVETPCNFVDNKLPVLDVTVNVNVKEHNRIDFEFFEKPTKNPRVIMADSALSFSKKRTILTQECLRRLRNTKVELGPHVQAKHLNQFMLKLKNSGYNCKFRQEILDSGLKAFEKMTEDDKKGIKPMYRGREWNADERKKSKSKKKLNWWNNEKAQIQYKTVLFVTPTPGGVLAKQLRQREEELNHNSKDRIKKEEKGGMTMKDI